MKNNNPTRVRFILFIPALLFLFEPYLTTVDSLPNFLGYALILSAIKTLSDIDTYFFEARKWFTRAIWVGVIRAALPVILAYIKVQDSAQVLLWQTISIFVLNFADAWLTVLAFSKLSEGFQNTSTFLNGKAVTKCKYTMSSDGELTPYGSNACEKFARFTYVFIIIRNLLNTLPEFTTLIDNREYTYVGLLRLMSIFFAAIIGIIWLIKGTIFITSVLKDKQYINSLNEKHSQKLLDRKDYFQTRRVYRIIIFIIVALIFSMEFYVDSYSMIPDFLSAALLIIAALLLRKNTKKWFWVLIPSVFSLAASSVYTYFLVNYFKEFRADAYIRKYEIAGIPYLKMYYSCLISSVVYAITIGMLFIVIYDVSKKTLSSRSAISGEYFVDKELMHDIAKKLTVGFILCVLSCAGTVYYLYAQPFVSSYCEWYIGMSTVISITIDIVFISYSAYILSDITDEMKLRSEFL